MNDMSHKGEKGDSGPHTSKMRGYPRLSLGGEVQGDTRAWQEGWTPPKNSSIPD